ncbi:MAG: thioredoxin family protein [Planctomycetota bacterium]|jgi:protein disulfide-isomerase
MLRPLILTTVIVVAALVLILVNAYSTGHADWLTDYDQALAESQRTGKPILANFAGSDWCDPCMALDRRVFETSTFASWAEENVVLLFLDFPRNKPMPDALREQNAELETRYEVDGYPTIVFLDSGGVAFGRIDGYAGEGPGAWLGQATRILESAPNSPALEATPPLVWTEDLAAAKARAVELNRPLMLNFSGSDWCKVCWMLDEEVFSTESFKAFARENLVLVLIDFPLHKDQSEELAYRNEQLEIQYRVPGYPTLVLLSPEGNPLGTMSYMEGGPELFLRKLKSLLP